MEKTQAKSEQIAQEKRRHFLFHIFRIDKSEHPMPRERMEMTARTLRRKLREKENTYGTR